VPSRHSAPPRGGWFRRFVRRHGWRAYAIPLLTIATLVTLVDVVTTATDGNAGSGAASTAQPRVLEAPASTAPTAPIAPAEGEGAPAQLPTEPAVHTFVQQGAGTVSVVDGASAVYGTGPLERFLVEVEDGIGVDGAQFAAAVESTLGDPRSWGNGGRMSFQRVGAAEAAAGDYDFRVSLVSPGNMEIYCPGVGTGGYTSCRYGERAVINLARWETAVPDYAGDIATYRLYVVNHEVGHALGNGHEQCPGPGQLAPVMQQQTLGLQGCVKNAWPYPS
jgi:predicted Zn-dependent protease